MGYEVLRYRPDLKPAALALLAHAWGPEADRNARTFAWKFERNPYLDRPLLQIVAAEGRPVAIRSLHGVRWLCGTNGAELHALGTGDFAIDPAYRGRHFLNSPNICGSSPYPCTPPTSFAGTPTRGACHRRRWTPFHRHRT